MAVNSFTNPTGASSLSRSEQDWQRIRDALLGTDFSAQLNNGAVGNVANRALTGMQQVAAASGATNTGGTPTQVQATSSAPKSTPTDSRISNDRETKPGQYYSGYPDLTIGKLRDDPATAAREWAKFYGWGGDAYSKYMSSVIQDPLSVLKSMGVNAGSLVSSTDQLDWQRRLWDSLSGRAQPAGTDNNYYVDPRGMVSNILGATYNKTDPSGSLGNMLNDSSLLPEQQVQNTVNLLLNSLQGFVSDDVLNAYASTLQKLGQDFLSIRNQKPESWDTSNTFNKYVASQLGSGGGLF